MSVTFTRQTMSHVPSTGLVTPTESTVVTNAIQVRGEPQRYAALGLSLQTMPTLLIAPDDYELEAWSPDFIMPGDTVRWPGSDSPQYTVKDVNVTAPDGIVVCARVVIAR